MKKGFTLVELLVVITIIGILASIGLNSFTSSQKKSRDAKRKAYLRQISDAFEAYYNDKGGYPAPTDDGSGNIKGCDADAEQDCSWGDIFQNATTETIYMIQLPEDMTTGHTFFYDAFLDAGVYTKYQLYARLENNLDKDVPKDADSNPQVFSGLDCGDKFCNYGISSSNTTAETNRTLVDDPDV